MGVRFKPEFMTLKKMFSFIALSPFRFQSWELFQVALIRCHSVCEAPLPSAL